LAVQAAAHAIVQHDEWNTLIGIATLADGNALRDRRALLAEHIKSDWLASDYNQIERTNGSWYNTSLLVRRSYLDRHRLSARLFVRHLPSGFRRSMHYVELYDVSGVALRIGTVHLDHPVDSTGRRRQQLNLALDTLQADDVPAVLGGDFNLASPAELIPVFAQHRVADALVHYDAGPTFGLTYPGPNGAARLDYLLASRHFGATEGRRIGGQSIRVPPGAALPSKLGRGGQVYPSDHLGLFARLEVVGEDVSGGL
jgi:endonuclease/exonuclease/phosphatase family metal-dependent hydrolase